MQGKPDDRETGPHMTHLVDLGQLVDLINGIVLVVHCVRNDKQAHVSRLRECAIQILRSSISLETLVPRINLSNGLLETLFECPPDGHDFTDGLHGRTDLPVDLGRELG